MSLHPDTSDFLDHIVGIWRQSGIPPELAGSSPNELAAILAEVCQEDFQGRCRNVRANRAMDHIVADMRSGAANERIAAMLGYT